jgi:hypothetical protein
VRRDGRLRGGELGGEPLHLGPQVGEGREVERGRLDLALPPTVLVGVLARGESVAGVGVLVAFVAIREIAGADGARGDAAETGHVVVDSVDGASSLGSRGWSIAARTFAISFSAAGTFIE